MKENHLICDDCKSLDEDWKKCEKCGEKYCVHNVSETNLSYCYNCMNPTMSAAQIMREQRRVNPSTGQITTVSVDTGVTQFHFEGSDWIYAVQKIKDFSSDPLGDWKFTKMAEYYKKLGDEMIRYREDVKQAKRDKERASGISQIRIPGSNGGVDKVLSTTIHSPEEVARKNVTNILKMMGKSNPTQQEVDIMIQQMRAAGAKI